jgi:DnaJ-class molecular chaperone
MKCKTCYGSGYILVQCRFSDMYVKEPCPDCNGTGEVKCDHPLEQRQDVLIRHTISGGNDNSDDGYICGVCGEYDNSDMNEHDWELLNEQRKELKKQSKYPDDEGYNDYVTGVDKIDPKD